MIDAKIAKERIKVIIKRIINGEDIYVLDDQFIRWGKVEKDLCQIVDELDTGDMSKYYQEEVEDTNA